MDRFMRAVHRLHKGQRGLTGLETAIILIAFVTVAAVFGYAVLSAGIFSADKAKGTVYQGMEEAKSSMELKGSVIATQASNDTAAVGTVKFIVGNSIGEYPIDLTPPGEGNDNVTTISYADENQYDHEIENWSYTHLSSCDDDNLLEIGEQFLITVDLETEGLATALGTNQVFTLEIKPPHGAVIVMERRTPAEIDPVMDLK